MNNLPKHIALIPDGNRRWAKKHNLPTFEGHQRGFARVREISRKAREMGIKIFTIWAFSTENWRRSPEEVSYLMKIYEQWIAENLKEAIEDEVRIVHIGRKDRLNVSLKDAIQKAEDKTKNFNKYYFVIALDYGGRDSILRGIKKYLASGNEVDDLVEEKFSQALETAVLPQAEPDLIIRTSGEQRLSGFLPWEGIYAELIFVAKYLPDFTADDFAKCIEEYTKHERRFGK